MQSIRLLLRPRSIQIITYPGGKKVVQDKALEISEQKEGTTS